MAKARSEVIKNGNFSQWGTDWILVRDVEIGAASSYLTRGSSNDYMVEMDGSA